MHLVSLYPREYPNIQQAVLYVRENIFGSKYVQGGLLCDNTPILYPTLLALSSDRLWAGASLRGCDVAGHGLDSPFHHARLFSSV